MVFQRDSSLYTLQMFLREILVVNTTGGRGDDPSELLEASLATELVKYCTVVVSTAPILFVYPFLQKYFEKGIMIGAVKG
jgi:putative aldouronate transport system permease protein